MGQELKLPDSTGPPDFGCGVPTFLLSDPGPTPSGKILSITPGQKAVLWVSEACPAPDIQEIGRTVSKVNVTKMSPRADSLDCGRLARTARNPR